ncbi:hypothetical protein ABTO49_22105, partial [Acinetobacter baumannii]
MARRLLYGQQDPLNQPELVDVQGIGQRVAMVRANNANPSVSTITCQIQDLASPWLASLGYVLRIL